MLDIRQEQINLMATQRLSLYVCGLAQYCRDNFAENVKVLENNSPAVSLTEFIEASIPDARSFGFVSSKHISEFTLLALRLFPSVLKEFTWTSSIFSQTAKNNTTKIAELTTSAELKIAQQTIGDD